MRHFPFALALSCLSLAFALIGAEPIKERTVTFEAVPKLTVMGAETKHPYAFLLLERHGLFCFIDPSKLKLIQEGRKYRFELIEVRTYFQPESKIEIWTPELHRVFYGDSVIYDASICKIHQAAKKRTEVPVTYNTPGGSEAYLKAFRTKFRHYGLITGRSAVMPENPTTMTWVCKHCKAAKEGRGVPAP